LEEIERTAETVCTLGGLKADVCNGLVVEFGPEFVYLINDTYRGHSRDICWVLGQCGSPSDVVAAREGWRVGHTLEQLPTASQRSQPAAADGWSWPWPLHDPSVGTFLQLTDLHYDADYTAGTATNCGRPTCCHSTDGIGVPPFVAGLFGDYHCDGSPALQDALMAAVAALDPAPDFVLWTGDEAPDNVWSQSREDNVASMTELSMQLMEALPPGTPVFPTVGNRTCPLSPGRFVC
jgi:hypothetical protein